MATSAASTPDERIAKEAAVRFAAEFARLGYCESRIIRLFADPFYAEAHAALRRLGESDVRHLVASAVADRAPPPRPTPLAVKVRRSFPD